MEEINKILNFIGDCATVTGTGSGAGDGSGAGYCLGDGDGTSYGTGYGYGSGDGSDSGAGTGSGSGYVTDSGYVTGYGTRDGSGYGSDDGIGDGSDDGIGDGSGDVDFIKIKKIGGDLVFYIGQTPIILDKICGNFAKGRIIREEDFFIYPCCYIARSGCHYFYGDTPLEVIENLKNNFNRLN